MEVTRALATGRRLLREHGLDDWTIVADRAKTRAGVCRFARARSASAPRSPRCTPRPRCSTRSSTRSRTPSSARSTGTTRVWRAKAREIGCSGERCVSSDAPRVPGDWVGRCPAGHEKTRHRAPTRLMSCGKCSRRFDPRHLFTWTYRGRPATLPRSYAAQLAALSATRRALRSSSRRPRWSATSSRSRRGRGRGWSARSSWSGAVRCQVRVDDDELVSLPLEAVRVLPGQRRAAITQPPLSPATEPMVAQPGRGARGPGEHAHAAPRPATRATRGQ